MKIIAQKFGTYRRKAYLLQCSIEVVHQNIKDYDTD